MSKQKNILQNQREKSMFLNLTKNQNSNDERYVQKKTNLDTKIHRITGKNNKKSKKNQAMAISSEKTPEVLRGAFKIRKTKVVDNTGSVIKRSKEQFRKKFCIFLPTFDDILLEFRQKLKRRKIYREYDEIQ